MLFDDFQRVSRRRPCPVCEHADWCLVSRDDPRAPARALCQRVPSARRWREAGWLHVLRSDVRPGIRTPGMSRSGRIPRIAVRPAPAREREQSAGFGRSALIPGLEKLPGVVPPTPAPIAALEPHARALGVTAHALAMLHAGVSSDGALMFPMRDELGRIIGIRLRNPDGRKLAVRGSRQGLFFDPDPPDLRTTPTSPPTTLCICEGPTDTLAALSAGLPAIGLPSARCGFELCLRTVQALRPAHRRVVVVADADPVGHESASALAGLLHAVCTNVRVMTPPEGIKDLRAWLIACGPEAVRDELSRPG